MGVFLSQNVISMLCESGTNCVPSFTNILQATLFTNYYVYTIFGFTISLIVNFEDVFVVSIRHPD